MWRGAMVSAWLMLAAVTAERGTAQTPAGDPMAGNWKLNVERSTFSPGPAPRALTYRLENRPDGTTLYVTSGVSATGAPTFGISIRRYDGRDYPIYGVAAMVAWMTTGATTNGTQASRIIDARTVEIVNKTDGRVTSTHRRTLATDGRTFTTQVTGTDAQGRQINNVEVWERQDTPGRP